MPDTKLDAVAATRLVYSTMEEIRKHGSARAAVNGAIYAVAKWCVSAVVNMAEDQRSAAALLEVLETEAKIALDDAFDIMSQDEDLLRLYRAERNERSNDGR